MFETKKKPDPTWLTLPQMHAAFALTGQGFHKSIRPLIPPDAIRDAGERGAVRVHCRTAIDSYAESVAAKRLAKENKPDPLLAGGDSPELERYRRFRADISEMERDRLKGALVPREELDPALAQLAGVLRRAAETLQRQYGPDAAAILNEALDETLAKWEARK